MYRHETILPLTLGLFVALAVHMAGAVGVQHWRSVDALNMPSGMQRLDQPPKPLPDLAVTKMVIGDERIPGKAVPIVTVVKNLGTKPVSNFALALTADDAPVALLTLASPLEPGRSIEQTFQYTATTGGIHRLRVIADPENQIEEITKDNNLIEQAQVWKQTGGSASMAGRPDLAVYSIDVPTPRIAGDPSHCIIALANLGNDVKQPFDVHVMVDDKIAAVFTVNGLAGASMAGTTQTIRVKTVGEHEVKVIVDNARLVDDANRANNTLARKFTWLSSADNEIKIGQKDPSPVEINWIGWDDYRKLEAKQAKFEQAALQKSVTPTPDATTMPLDPTPPGRNQPAVVSQPSPPPAPAKQASPATPKMIAKAEPDPKPAVQNVPPAAKPLDPKQAPAMAKAETKLAAAPKQDEKPQPPVKLEAKGKTDQTQLMTGDKPADKPVAAPPMNLKPARDFALSSKPVPSNPGHNASLPEPVKNGKIADVSEKHAPQIAPDSKSNPDNKSRRIDGEPNQPPMLAVLPTKPQLKDPAGSPQKQTPEKNVPVDRTQQAPQKPVDPVKKTADGNQQQPTPEMQPTPASPAQKPVPPSPPPQPASSARPTPAPKTERESAPVTLIQGLKIHPGKVLAQQGLQINTVNARFSTVAMMTSAPINPDVVVVFNKTGEVAKAEIIRSTGYANIDGPILASLYKWTAQGEILQKVPATLTIQVHILLGPE